jgi:2-polyprenyl-3-methyl-5-hydroxy-6-metoxy-1,4-benzoquinol methylase
MDYDYTNYWADEFEKRKSSRYYENLYDNIKDDLKVSNDYDVLDVGGGNGQVMYYLDYNPVFYSLSILDISDSGLKFAKEKLGYHTIKGDVTKRFPITEESFDVAYCLEVLEHLDMPNKTLCEIHDVLKPGGLLFVSVPNFKPDGIHHKKRWLYAELCDDLKKCGFDILWFRNIPRFTLSYKQIINKPATTIEKAIMIIGHTLFPTKKIRNFLAEKMPDHFVSMYIIKCKKR